MRRVLPALLVLGGLAIAQSVYAQSEQETRERLDELRQRLSVLESAQEKDRSAQAALRRSLRDDEVKLGQLNRDLSDNKTALEAQQVELGKLQVQQQSLEKERVAQQQRVMRELRQAYQMGREGGLKALLNQDQPETLARALAYHGYIYDARQEAITAYRKTLNDLEAVAVDIQRTTEALQTTRASLAQQLSDIKATKASRQKTLVKINANIANRDQQREGLLRDRSQLENLLKSIEATIIALVEPESYRPFTAVKGKMPWPLAGKHRHRFGQMRNKGKMRWQGVTIPAVPGADVRAIHYGQIVFADWFRGSGLLVIVDHGDGFMSLYAHNQSVLVEVGEWVTAGTVVSTAGNSGGQDSTALYFEIRHNGKPVNPAKWCG